MLTAEQKVLLTCAESSPFDDQCLFRTANYPPTPFLHFRNCFDPCNAAAVADYGYYLNSYFSWHRGEEAFAFRVAALALNYCDASVAVAVVVAAAYDAAAFPRVVDEVSAMVDAWKIDFHRAFPRTMLADCPLVTEASRSQVAFPSVDFLDDMKDVHSLVVVDDAVAFDCAVQEDPMRGDGLTVVALPQDSHFAGRPDHQKAPSS